MSDILGLTTSEAVASILGLHEVELSATDISNAELDQELQYDLLTWLPVTYTTIISEGTGGSPTDEQMKKIFYETGFGLADRWAFDTDRGFTAVKIAEL